MMQNTEILIVDAAPKHYDAVLKLNHKLVHFLSPLDLKGLNKLAQASDVFSVVLKENNVIAFMIALCEGKDYHSVNYRWFEQTYDKFLYVDRIVVSPDVHGLGIGKQLYDDLFDVAKRLGRDLITAEINARPINEQSLYFHKKMGFSEVGRQVIDSGKKEVSMQLKLLSNIKAQAKS